jgi:hypothetical protein
MTVPHRRRDPQPISQGWEAAVAVIGSAVILLVLAALFGTGGASVLFGRGWVWPHGAGTAAHVIGGLLTGHPGRGFDPQQRRLLAVPPLVYVCVVVSEFAAITAAAVVGVLIVRYRRPNDARGGMATRRDAERVLGLSTLNHARSIIRPDLYPRAAATSPWRRHWQAFSRLTHRRLGPLIHTHRRAVHRRTD